MGVVLTKAAKNAWEVFCGDRPGEELPTLIDVMKNAREIERPENLNGDHLLAYQHPEFRSIFFVVTINEDMEEVVIGIRFVRPNRKAKATQNKEHKPEHSIIEWDKLPDGLNDLQILDWCIAQTGIAHGRIASGTCNKSQCNARITEIACIRKQAGHRMAKPKLDPLRKVKNRDDFERGQDRERGDIINFIKEYYPQTLDCLVHQILNGQHRTPLET